MTTHRIPIGFFLLDTDIPAGIAVAETTNFTFRTGDHHQHRLELRTGHFSIIRTRRQMFDSETVTMQHSWAVDDRLLT